MGLGHAHRMVPAQGGEALRGQPGARPPLHQLRLVDDLGQTIDLGLQGLLVPVQQVGLRVAFVGSLPNGGGQIRHAGAALGEAVRLGHRGPGVMRGGGGGLHLGATVRGKAVDRHHRRQAVHLDDAHGVGQVLDAHPHSVHIGGLQVLAPDAAVPAQPAHRGHHHRRRRRRPALAHLDVHEFLEAEMGAKAGLRDRDVGAVDRQAVRQDGTAAVGDVAERPHVDDGRLALQGLRQVGLHGVPQQRHQGADAAHFPGGHRLVVLGPADHHVS